MPSAFSGRYQSRFFNFIHQQSRRLSDSLQRTFRYLQVVTSWSLEALLHSIHLLMQTAAESVGRQLRGVEQQPRLLPGKNTDSQSETPPSADTSIQRVLEAVKMGASPSTLEIVRGIASHLVNRNLVLVTVENEILDILTLQQQEQLQNRMIDEVANYWSYWREFEVKDHTKLFTEIDHLLTKLTSNSRDKMPALPDKTRVEDSIESTSSLASSQALVFLDAAVAKLESNALVPMSRATSLVQQLSSSLVEVVQTQFDIFLYGKQQLIKSGQEAVAVDNFKNQPLNIPALIWAALNYFFGERTAKKVKQSTPANGIYQIPQGKELPQHPPQALPESAQLQSDDISDPWLTMSDLFGDFQEVTEVASSQTINPALPTSPSSVENLIHHFQIPTLKPKQAFGLVRQQKPNRDLGTGIPSSPLPTTQVEVPDLIETNATTIGYEKHPLEQILEWLDRAMLLLEEILMKIVQSLQRLWRRK